MESARNSIFQLNDSERRREWWQSQPHHSKSSGDASPNSAFEHTLANSPGKVGIFKKI
jgi:hypothetical protein